jgi:putative FmdB family regulatory protein
VPLYTHQCPTCGAFDDLRPASLSASAADCPKCGQAAPRVILAPRLPLMDRGLRRAHEVNERNRHEPTHSTQEARAQRHEHGPGCSCCSDTSKKSTALYGPDGSKTFPTKRPWMISH